MHVVFESTKPAPLLQQKRCRLQRVGPAFALAATQDELKDGMQQLVITQALRGLLLC